MKEIRRGVVTEFIILAVEKHPDRVSANFSINTVNFDNTTAL